MTEKQLREKVVIVAKQFIGCKEADGSHKKFIDRHNTFQPLDAQCATFVGAVSI